MVTKSSDEYKSKTRSIDEILKIIKAGSRIFIGSGAAEPQKLIRMLIGKMSLKKLQEMIQIIFIEETEAILKKESPGKNVALGDIALQTGVDTRTIKKIRAYIESSNPIHQDDTFLDGFMPLFKVFDLWMNDARFFNADTRKPRPLSVARSNG